MKKILVLMFAATLVVTSCSKEARLNRKLEGTWNVQSYTQNGIPVSLTGLTRSITFTKDKKGVGNYSMTTTILSFPTVETGTYAITSDTKITKTQVAPVVTSGSAITVMNIVSFSKTDMTLSIVTSSGTDVYVLKKI